MIYVRPILILPCDMTAVSCGERATYELIRVVETDRRLYGNYCYKHAMEMCDRLQGQEAEVRRCLAGGEKEEVS